MAYTIAPLYDDVARTVPAGVETRSDRQGFASAVDRLFDTITVWRRRAEERSHLLALDDRMLADIGLDRVSAAEEAAKPFWKA